MTTKPVPVALKRFTDAYDMGITERKFLGGWLRDHHWNKAYKTADESKLSPTAIKLIDLFNAFMSMTTYTPKNLALAYSRVARALHHIDDATISLWFKELEREYKAVLSSDDDITDQWKRSYFFTEFTHICEITRYSEEFFWPESFAPRLTTVIRLAGPKAKYTGEPLIFSRKNADLLYPHYSIHEYLNDREILEAEGILRLHEAWRTSDDHEQQKIKRFVMTYADKMDAALAIMELRYVDTLEQLDSLMQQTGDTVALSEGAL